MSAQAPSLFSQVIQDHLDLKRRNSELDSSMPLARYTSDDPFDNHPLFKTEEQARLEETMDGMESEVMAHTVAWPGEESIEVGADKVGADNLWGRSRDFDWGD